MKINKESMILYYRGILQNKSKPELIRENARKELMKLLGENK